jgi:hypothetical protein
MPVFKEIKIQATGEVSHSSLQEMSTFTSKAAGPIKGYTIF